jgi:hypothetical protein
LSETDISCFGLESKFGGRQTNPTVLDQKNFGRFDIFWIEILRETAR